MASAQTDVPLIASIHEQTDQVYEALRKKVAPTCQVQLPLKLTRSDSPARLASASMPAGKVQIVVTAGEELWLALAAYFGEKRSQSSWNRLLEAMASLSDQAVAGPTKLPIWKMLTDEEWAGWKGGFRARIAFVLAHELGHACLGHLNNLTPAVCEDRKIGIYTCLGGARCREADADEWAISQLKQLAKDQGLSLESVIGGLMELAIFDATMGRIAGRPDASATHPVSVCRYNLLAAQLKLSSVADIYLNRLSSINGCLEDAPAMTEQLRRLAASPELVCVLTRTDALASSPKIGVRLGDSLTHVKLVQNPIGAALYGSYDEYLSTVSPQSKVKRENLIAPSHVLFGNEEIVLTAATRERAKWGAAIRGLNSAAPKALAQALEESQQGPELGPPPGHAPMVAPPVAAPSTPAPPP